MTAKAKHNGLTVLHVATVHQPITPDLGYGPIEAVIYNVDRGLHLSGLRSIVACSGDSIVAGEQYVTIKKSIGDYWSEDTQERRKAVYTHLSKALERVKMGDINIIHAHDTRTVEFLYDGVFSIHVPIVMTLHLSPEHMLRKKDYDHWSNITASPLVYCVPISEYQKRQYHELIKTENVIHHGIDVDGYPVKERPDKESYLFSIGRVTRDKGQDIAIEVAKKTGSKLIIAGMVQNKSADKEYFEGLKNSIDFIVDVAKYPADNNYYDRAIKPLLDGDKQIIFIGEISREQRNQWYRHARATLFPIQWGEPFGLVMIESMACGTPTVAFNKGAVPEIILDGKTGFVVDNVSEMVGALEHIDNIDPQECRRHVQDNFSIKSMAHKYSELYRRIVNEHRISNDQGMRSDNITKPPLQGGKGS